MKFLEPTGLILILVIVIILFGPRRFPDMAKPFRRRMTVFRDDRPSAPAPPVAKPADKPATSPADEPAHGDGHDASDGSAS